MDLTADQAKIHRNGLLAANIRAGRSPMTPEIIETILANARANLDIPGPRVLQLLDELRRLREIDRAVRKALAALDTAPAENL